MWVRMEKIVCTVLHAAHERQVEERMDALLGRAGALLQEPPRRLRVVSQ